MTHEKAIGAAHSGYSADSPWLREPSLGLWWTRGCEAPTGCVLGTEAPTSDSLESV